MTVLPVLAVGILMKFTAVLFILVSLVLILVVLIQKGRGGGLSGAFGGGMASGLLGSKTGDFLTWVTVGLVSVFLLLAVLMARYYRPKVGSYGAAVPPTAQQTAPAESSAAPQPATTEQPAPAASSSVPPAGATQPSAPVTSAPDTSGTTAPATAPEGTGANGG